jgi:hypothetical protein
MVLLCAATIGGLEATRWLSLEEKGLPSQTTLDVRDALAKYTVSYGR